MNPSLLLCKTDPNFFQLAEIRRVKLSSILCDNSDDIENIQVLILIMIRPGRPNAIIQKTSKIQNSRLPKIFAGVRDGAARPRDQPAGSLQVRRPSKDRPQPVERRLLPLSSLPELPQWLREEVEEALLHIFHPLVRSSQPPFLLLVRHARTLSPMSDSLVVFISTNMPCPVVFHRHSDILILVTSSIRVSAHIRVHSEKTLSTSLLNCLKFFLQISVSFWLVGSSSSSSGASEPPPPPPPPPPPAAAFVSHFRLQSGSALLPLGISAWTACQFQTLK